MRRIHLVIGVMVALAAATSARTMAMEEQRGAAPAGVGPDAPKAQADDSATAEKADQGTEIRVPGLGKLGTLPKMDFGLELLYGADETKAVADPEGLDQRDMMIHGSVRHRF